MTKSEDIAVKSTNATIKTLITVMFVAIAIGTIVFSSGSLKKEVQSNTHEIQRVDTDGCKPSVYVREKIAGMIMLDENVVNNLNRVEEKVDKLDEKIDYLIENFK